MAELLTLPTLSLLARAIAEAIKKVRQMKDNEEAMVDLLETLRTDQHLIEKIEKKPKAITPPLQESFNEYLNVLEDLKKFSKEFQRGNGKEENRIFNSSSSSRASVALSRADSNGKRIDAFRHKFQALNIEITLRDLARSESGNSTNILIESYEFCNDNISDAFVTEDSFGGTYCVMFCKKMYHLKFVEASRCSKQNVSLEAVEEEVRRLEKFHDSGVATYYHHFFSAADPSGLCCVMENVCGDKLSQRIGRKPFAFRNNDTIIPSAAILYKWLGQCENALEHMHEAGIAHGNLRPENIVINLLTDDIKLTNVDITSSSLKNARCQDFSSQNVDFECVYMSLSRLETKDFKPSPSDDLWAVGCIFAEFLMAKRFNYILSNQPKEKIESVIKTRAALFPSFCEVLEKLLQPDPPEAGKVKDLLDIGKKNAHDFAFHIGDDKKKKKKFSMVRLSEGESAPETVDCIYVLSVPLRGWEKWPLPIKATHSVVIMLHKRSGKGYMLEYTDCSEVLFSPCRLVRRPDDDEVHCFGPFSHFEGFYECSFDMSRLSCFNNIFEEFSTYHYHRHNCHVFHMSLAATAMLSNSSGNTIHYAYRQKSWLGKNVFDSKCTWALLKEGDHYTRKKDIEFLGKDHISFRNKVLEVSRLIATEDIAYLEYDSEQQTIVCESGMSFTIQNIMDGFKDETDAQSDFERTRIELQREIDSKRCEEILKILLKNMHLKDFGPIVTEAKELLENELEGIKNQCEHFMNPPQYLNLASALQQNKFGLFHHSIWRAEILKRNMIRVKAELEMALHNNDLVAASSCLERHTDLGVFHDIVTTVRHRIEQEQTKHGIEEALRSGKLAMIANALKSNRWGEFDEVVLRATRKREILSGVKAELEMALHNNDLVAASSCLERHTDLGVFHDIVTTARHRIEQEQTKHGIEEALRSGKLAMISSALGGNRWGEFDEVVLRATRKHEILSGVKAELERALHNNDLVAASSCLERHTDLGVFHDIVTTVRHRIEQDRAQTKHGIEEALRSGKLAMIANALKSNRWGEFDEVVLRATRKREILSGVKAELEMALHNNDLVAASSCLERHTDLGVFHDIVTTARHRIEQEQTKHGIEEALRSGKLAMISSALGGNRWGEFDEVVLRATRKREILSGVKAELERALHNNDLVAASSCLERHTDLGVFHDIVTTVRHRIEQDRAQTKHGIEEALRSGKLAMIANALKSNRWGEFDEVVLRAIRIRDNVFSAKESLAKALNNVNCIDLKSALANKECHNDLFKAEYETLVFDANNLLKLMKKTRALVQKAIGDRDFTKIGILVSDVNNAALFVGPVGAAVWVSGPGDETVSGTVIKKTVSSVTVSVGGINKRLCEAHQVKNKILWKAIEERNMDEIIDALIKIGSLKHLKPPSLSVIIASRISKISIVVLLSLLIIALSWVMNSRT